MENILLLIKHLISKYQSVEVEDLVDLYHYEAKISALEELYSLIENKIQSVKS